MLCAEQCTWVVSHLEVAMRRLGVKDQALPIIKQNCRPVTVLLKVRPGLLQPFGLVIRDSLISLVLSESDSSLAGLEFCQARPVGFLRKVLIKRSLRKERQSLEDDCIQAVL